MNCYLLLCALASTVCLGQAASFSDEEQSWMPQYNKIFNSHEPIEPSRTLELLRELDSTLGRLSAPMLSKRIQRVKMLIGADTVNESKCDKDTLTTLGGALTDLVEEQAVLFNSYEPTPALSYLEKKYDEHLQVCESLVSRKLQTALDSTKDRSLLNELADIVVKESDPLELESQYLDRERATKELANFLFKIDLQTQQLKQSCNDFESNIDASILESYPLLVVIDYHKFVESTKEGARIGTTCGFVADLPDSPDETRKWLAAHGFQASRLRKLK